MVSTVIFLSAPQSERLKRLSWSLHTCTSGELRLSDLLLWSSWANVTISGKLDIYDTLFQDQRGKGLSDLFISAFTSRERNSSRLTFTPLHVQSMERCLFLTWGDRQAAESHLLWPFARGSAALRARDLAHCSPGNVTSPGPAIHSAQSLRSFHSAFTMLP